MNNDAEQDHRPIYLLDWESINVEIEGTECSHELRRPTAEHSAAWVESQFNSKSKETEDAADVKLYDEIAVRAIGYDGGVPVEHKRSAVCSLYNRSIIPHEISRDGWISVTESFSGFAVITHKLRLPTNEELIGFQILISNSVLHAAGCYDLQLESIDGVRFKNGGEATRERCISLVDAPIKIAVFNAFLKAVSELMERPRVQGRLKKVRGKKKRRK